MRDSRDGGVGPLRASRARHRRSRSTRRLGLTLTWCAAAVALALPTVAQMALGVGVSPVLTSSMVPWVEPGDVIVTKGTPATQLRTGDVISAQRLDPATTFTHRIVQVAPVNGLLRLTTKGDANPAADVDPVMLSPGAEVQRAIGHVKWIGYPLSILASPQGQRLALTLLIGANAIALILFASSRRSQTPSPIRVEEQP